MSAPIELHHKPRRDEVLRVLIEALDEKGEGLGFVHATVGPQKAPMRFEVHVRRAVPGDLIDVQISGARRRRIDGWILELIEPSPTRIAPQCVHFPSDGERPGCGGCSLQLLSLDSQRALKLDRLRSLFTAQDLDPALVEPLRGVGDGWHYRNKMEFSFAGRPGELGLGMHPGGFKYEVIDQRECLIMSEWVSEAIPRIAEWARALGIPAYRGEAGFWRTVVVREGKNTGERMVELVTSHLDPDGTTAEAVAQSWSAWMTANVPDVSSLYWTQIRAVRGERTRRIEHHLGGRETLREELTVGGRSLVFEIAPSAFFQTNTAGAELLYSIVAEHAAPSGSEVVLDLYSGTGTIGLCLAEGAKAVLGIELVEASVANARQNAALNNISNVEFVAGDVGQVLADRSPSADVVVLDPPRAGLLPAAHDELARIDASRLVYVSCNPEALARDLSALQPTWSIERVRPVDMFPQTAHVETVVSLRRR